METGLYDRKSKVTSTSPRVNRRSFRSNWILLFVCAAVISFSSIIFTKPASTPQPPTQQLKIVKQVIEPQNKEKEPAYSIKDSEQKANVSTKEQTTTIASNSSSSPAKNESRLNATTSNQPPEAIRTIINPASLLNDTRYGNRTFHLVVLTRMRSSLLNQTLTKLFESIDPNGVDLTVYEHFYEEKTIRVIDSFPKAYRVNLMEPYLSAMYGAVFSDVLKRAKGAKYFIIMEDDLTPASDFFQYFQHFAPLLDKDRTLFSISAWSDSSFPYMIKDPTAVYRRNVFIGLGWMTSRAILEHVVSGWNFSRRAWDVSVEHWALENNYTHNLYPEIPRVHHSFLKGTGSQTTTWKNQAVFYENMALSTSEDTEFGNINDYTKEGYERLVKTWFESAIPIQDFDEALTKYQDKILVMYYAITNVDQLGNLYDYFGVLFHSSYSKSRQRDFCDGLTHYWVNSNLILFVEAETTFGRILLETKPSVKPINPQNLPVPNFGNVDESVTILVGNMSESCTTVCERNELECNAQKFHVVNSCGVLGKHFNCKDKDCSHIDFRLEGLLPEYYDYPGFRAQQCFTTTLRYVNCDTSGPGTKRLCPCVEIQQHIIDI